MARLEAAQTAPEVAKAPCLAPSGVGRLPQWRHQKARGRVTGETFTGKRGDTLFLPDCRPDPAAADPTGALGPFRFRPRNGAMPFSRAATAPVLNGTPKLACAWQAGDPDAAGPYKGESEGRCLAGGSRPSPTRVSVRSGSPKTSANLAAPPWRLPGFVRTILATALGLCFGTRRRIPSRTGRFGPQRRLFHAC